MPALAGLMAGCSPLGALNALGPRDGGAGRVARDLAYGSDERQRFDLFAPADGADLPVVVFFYGGGWDSGSRNVYGWAAQALAARGFLVALPDYRLVPGRPFSGVHRGCSPGHGGGGGCGGGASRRSRAAGGQRPLGRSASGHDDHPGPALHGERGAA